MNNTNADCGKHSLPLRFVVYHIHPVSARIRFLSVNRKRLCFPESLPEKSQLVAHPKKEDVVTTHPCVCFHQCCSQWDLPEAQLKCERHFRLWVEVASERLPIYLLTVEGPNLFTAPDSTEWVELADALGFPMLEREIMKAVYQWLLE